MSDEKKPNDSCFVSCCNNQSVGSAQLCFEHAQQLNDNFRTHNPTKPVFIRVDKAPDTASQATQAYSEIDWSNEENWTNEERLTHTVHRLLMECGKSIDTAALLQERIEAAVKFIEILMGITNYNWSNEETHCDLLTIKNLLLGDSAHNNEEDKGEGMTNDEVLKKAVEFLKGRLMEQPGSLEDSDFGVPFKPFPDDRCVVCDKRTTVGIVDVSFKVDPIPDSKLYEMVPGSMNITPPHTFYCDEHKPDESSDKDE